MSQSGDGSMSQSSYSTGADGSVADTADQRALNELQDRNEDGIASDLVEQNRTLEDAVFASLYTLSKNRKATDYRWTAARVVLEFLQMFRVIFNTVNSWNINTNLWIWKAFYWVLFRLVVMPKGYDSYIAVFYVIAAVVLVCIVMTVWVAVILKKDDNSSTWLRRLVAVLQLMAFIVFSVFWVAILDYIAFLFDCHWDDLRSPEGARHVMSLEHNCLAMPHLAHMAFGLVTLLLFCFAALCMSISDCDLNPLTRNHLASPVAVTGVKTMALKMAMVLLSTCMTELGKAQTVLMLICAAIIVYYMVTTVPYYYDLVNMTWVGLWCGILFTCCLLVALDYTLDAHLDNSLEYRASLTMAVLYGIFPAVLFGAAVCYCYMKYLRRPTSKLRAAYATGENNVVLKDVYRFKDETEAEFLLRGARKWDEDGVPNPDTTAFGEFMIKCAMARLPNRPYLLTLYSNFIIEVRKDGQAARTQLQLAVKNNPTLVERYFIYVSQEVAKKLKSESEGLDLIGYVEFQRSYRACVRAHKLALQAQRQFWHSMLRDSVSFRDLQLCFESMSKTEQQATAVYRRVLERYPTNGKLLKIYGRFLEYVRNDPWGASKFYGEAMKQGTGESLLSLAGSSSEGDSTNKLTTLLGNVDEKSDGIVIINAAGIIMMVNGACCKMFGYDKGDLDGKNVSTLMPQPFSTRHNSFVQRCATSGQARILGTVRQLVALHKDRSVFPINLAVQKLSGMGADTIFMAIIRNDVAEDESTVKVWCTTTGTVLCADDRFCDWFGLASKELVGRSISSLSTDIEGFDRFIASSSELPASQVLNGALCLRTKLLHKYLAPIEAEATVEFGGSEDQRILVVNLHCVADTLALMVTDTKGRIHFATSQLASMVGYSVKVLTDGMNLAGLLPPPYSQLHAGFMKDLSVKPPPGSCRSGAVVYLMHANNSKVPVTLQLSQHDDGERMQHVIKITPATEAQMLDQQRLELQLNHKGVVLSVNANSSKAVFGFHPQALVGRPLAAFVNVFGQWRGKFGEDESLLVMLGMRAEQNHDVIYRCGVHAPFKDDEMERGAAAGTTSGLGPGGTEHSLLGALNSRHKERPAIMSMQMVHNETDGDATAGTNGAATDADNTAVLTVSLWRAEGLTALVEVDSKLGIVRADPSTGLIFGVAHTALLRKSFKSLAGLPVSSQASELLSGSGKKSMLKEGAAWKTGPLKVVEARHVDESPMKLQIQAVSKDGKTTNRLLVMLRLLDAGTGSLQPFLMLRAAGMNSDAGPGDKLLAANADSVDEDDNNDEGGAADDRKRSGSPELHDRLDSRLRVAEWVSSSFRKGDDEDPTAEQPAENRGKRSSNQGARRPATENAPSSYGQGPPTGAGSVAMRRGAAGYDIDAAGAHGYVEVRMPGRGSMEGKPGYGKPGYEAGKGGDVAVNFGGAGDGGSSAGGGPGSVASGSQSAGGSDALDATSAASGMEDELVADWRRAKRLKKLNRMMTSSAAQVATDRFRRHTYMATLIIVVAHVVCFVVLLTQINHRYQTAYEVGDMAQAIERSQMVAMRTNFIQKCGRPDFATMDVCSPQSILGYIKKLQENYDNLKHIHHALYLGYTYLKQFSDPHLMNHWTYEPIPERTWFLETQNGTHVIMHGETSLWEMGNKYLRCSKDVQFNALELKYELGDTNYFNYIQMNGPESLFNGYRWSLDVFVDYAWEQLGTLNNVLVVLLIVEALLVQLTTMAYEFILLKAANCEAMKRFSVFLALPSATIRSMASRQLQVDDDDKSDLDDDELEAINATATAADGDQTQQASKDGQQAKSVRMSITGVVPEDGDGKKRLTGAGSRGGKGAAAAAAHKTPKSRWQQLKKLLFGWANTTFKINGKKLVPHNAVLWKFMVPLLLWVAAVIIIFGVSFKKLQGLQGPLASLNAAAHVRFRLARCRLMSNLYGFSESPQEVAEHRAELQEELIHFKKEYEALLYGGPVALLAEGTTFDANAPAAVFSNQQFSHIFFKTTDCLRRDKSGCFVQGDQYYDITHAGLDAMVSRYIDQMIVFANLPDAIAFPNHTSYTFATAVAANDMYDGLQDAAELMVEYTISRFEEVKQLHIILLVCTLVLMLLFVAKMFRPYVQRLHAESKAMAGMMSQLPAEVDIEGHVKTHVLGLRRDEGRATSLRMGSMDAGGAGGGSVNMPGPGGRTGPGGSMPALLPPPPAGAGRRFGGMMALPAGARGSAPGDADWGDDNNRSQPDGQWDDE